MSEPVFRLRRLCCVLALVAWTFPGRSWAQDAPATSAATAPTASPAAAPAADQSPQSLFRKFDANRDGILTGAEVTDQPIGESGPTVKEADGNGDGHVTREEFAAALKTPLLRDPRTLAALLLLVGFAGFCLFLDELLDPERREYYLWAILSTVVTAALAFLFASGWFITEQPYLAFVAIAPVVVVVLAIVCGATKEIERQMLPQGPVVYKVGSGGKSTASPASAGASSGGGTGPAAAPRRPAARPVRTVRPAPVPRPPVPERRPGPGPGSPPPQRPGGPPPRPGGPRPPGGGPAK